MLDGTVLTQYKGLKDGQPHKPLDYVQLSPNTAVSYGGSVLKIVCQKRNKKKKEEEEEEEEERRQKKEERTRRKKKKREAG